MATGFEIIGALTALSTAGAQLAGLCGWFRRCAKTVIHAKDDIQDLAQETTIVVSLLEFFHDNMQTMHKKGSPSARDPKKVKLVFAISRRSETIFAKLQNLLVKVEPLRRDKNHSRLLRMIAKLKWLVDKDDVEPLLRALDSVQMHLVLFTNLLQMDNTHEEIATLKAANKEISSELKQRATRYRKRVRQLKKQCEEAELRFQHLQASSLQQWELEDRSRDNITSLLIKVVNRELEEYREQRAQHGSDLSSDAPPDATDSLGEVIDVEERESERNRTRSDMSVVKQRNPSIDISVAPRTPESRRANEAVAIQTNQPPPAEAAQSPDGQWVPMPGWGEPRPQERPKAPRASQEDLPVCNVIYDDGNGIREEFRRPRKSRQRRSKEHNHHSSPGSALSSSSAGRSPATSSGSSVGPIADGKQNGSGLMEGGR